MSRLVAAPLAVLAGLLLVGCGGSTPSGATAAGGPARSTGGSAAATGARYPDVVAVDATRATDGTWTFAVTLSSPYDSPQRYADAWRVRSVEPGGAVYGVRELAHDHAGEQPFTREKSGIAIPAGVTQVVVEGRDLANGYGGATVTYRLPS